MLTNTTKILHFDYSRWNQLSAEQLQTIKDIQCKEYSAPIMMQLDIFLYLAGLRYATDGASAINELMTAPSEDEKALYNKIDKFHDYMNGDIVVLESIKDKEERYLMPLDTLRAAVVEYTKWIDEDHSLIVLPIENITVGKNEYRLPEGFLANLTYQQYTSSQHYLEAYWNVINYIENLIKAEAEKTEADKDYVTDKDTIAHFTQLSEQAEEYQRCFLAHMLTPYHNEGEQRYDEEGKPFTFIRRLAKFNVNDIDIAKEDMKSAPKWLFPLVYQQLQDNLRQFKDKFPDLFSEHSDNGKHDAFVAELGTINVIIEKGSYPSAEAVYDENAIFIFKRLDMLQEEAREMKAAMSKSSKK